MSFAVKVTAAASLVRAVAVSRNFPSCDGVDVPFEQVRLAAQNAPIPAGYVQSFSEPGGGVKDHDRYLRYCDMNS